MACLEGISNELLHNILIHVEPANVATLCKSSPVLNSYIKNNRIFFKDLYLLNWDPPSGPQEPCWEIEVQKMVRLQKLLECEDIETKRAGQEIASSAITSLMAAKTPQLNGPWLTKYFLGRDNIDSFLAASSLFEHAGTASQSPAATRELRQASAHLHCLYGVPIDSPKSASYLQDDMSEGRTSYRILIPSPGKSEGPATRSRTINIPTNTYARSKVYDLRQYSEGSFWGPFKDDGSQDVDWEKVEAIMVVLGYNLRMFRERARFEIEAVCNSPWYGASPYSFVSPASPKLTKELGAPGDLIDQDPYGVSGMWNRVVCFLDYHDLYAFNFARPAPAPGSPREPIDTREAIRMIKLRLRVTSIDPPGEEDGQDYPVVTFKGTSWSLHSSWDPNANSLIRGCVKQTPQGEIRWITWSIFHGEERWRSEGIQVGGIRSARGVLGNWFDKDYDVHGPAGPTAFWKISDELDEDYRPDTPPLLHPFGPGDDINGDNNDSD